MTSPAEAAAQLEAARTDTFRAYALNLPTTQPVQETKP